MSIAGGMYAAFLPAALHGASSMLTRISTSVTENKNENKNENENKGGLL
jgi:hypothetical protein